ncbi:hypothetical protein [Rhodoflexus sp.]
MGLFGTFTAYLSSWFVQGNHIQSQESHLQTNPETESSNNELNSFKKMHVPLLLSFRTAFVIIPFRLSARTPNLLSVEITLPTFNSQLSIINPHPLIADFADLS